MTRPLEPGAVPITIVTTRDKHIHVFQGNLFRDKAISEARAERPYALETVFIVFYTQFDTAKPTQAAKEINKNAELMRKLTFT